MIFFHLIFKEILSVAPNLFARAKTPGQSAKTKPALLCPHELLNSLEQPIPLLALLRSALSKKPDTQYDLLHPRAKLL
jgi:hypothetical protein